jgi:hypothetical protein
MMPFYLYQNCRRNPTLDIEKTGSLFTVHFDDMYLKSNGCVRGTPLREAVVKHRLVMQEERARDEKSDAHKGL